VSARHLVGLHAALSAAGGAAAPVLAGGRPSVSALPHYLLTIASQSSREQEARILVPKTERGYHPLCAVNTPACLGPAARRLADGRVTDESLTASGDPDRLFASVNTSTEYRAIEANGMQS